VGKVEERDEFAAEELDDTDVRSVSRNFLLSSERWLNCEAGDTQTATFIIYLPSNDALPPYVVLPPSLPLIHVETTQNETLSIPR
jgi:hypothetical protein